MCRSAAQSASVSLVTHRSLLMNVSGCRRRSLPPRALLRALSSCQLHLVTAVGMSSEYVMRGVILRAPLCSVPSTRRRRHAFPCRPTYDLVSSPTASGTRCRANRSSLTEITTLMMMMMMTVVTLACAVSQWRRHTGCVRCVRKIRTVIF